MDATTSMEKSHLPGTTLCQFRVMSVTEQRCKSALIRLKRFLKCTPSAMKFEKGSLCFSVAVRKGMTVEFTVTASERYRTVDCFVLHSLLGPNCSMSDIVPATRISAKKHKVVLTRGMFVDCETGDSKESDGDVYIVMRFKSGREHPPETYPLLRSRALYGQVTELSYHAMRVFGHLLTEEDDISFTMEECAWKGESTATDFVLSVQGRQIFAHRALLASRSTYFREHIRRGNGAIRIDAAAYESVVAVVRFLYTGRLDVRPPDEMVPVLELARRLNVTGILRLWAIRSAGGRA